MILEIVFRTVLAMLLLSGSIVLGIHFTKDDPTEVLFPVVLYTKKTMFRLDFHFRRAIEIQTYVRERATHNGSTVVEISIPPPTFKLVSLSLPRSLLL